MYARKPSRSHASHQSVHKQYQVVQTPPKLVINTYNAPKQIPPIQLSEEHSLRLSDSRAGIRYNLMGKRGEPLTYEHPNQVIVTVLDSDGGGVRTGVYNHEDVSVSRIIDDIPKELTFQINSRQTRKDGITIDDADAVKTELINKLSIIPELTKEFLVASKDLSVIEPVPEVTSQTTAENKAEVNSKVAQSSEPLNAASQPLNVADMSVTEKLAETMKRAARRLPKSVGEQLLAMVNPTSLFVMVGVLGAYAASHAVGIGVIADAVMAVGAGATIGWQGVSAAKELWGFAQFVNATTEEDLDKAGQHLANFITTIGIDIVIGILFKKAAGKVKGAGNLDEADEVNAGRVDEVDNARSIDKDKPTTEEPINTSSKQVDEVISNNRSGKMSSSARVGVDPSEYSIKVGTVRMKEHPNYQNLISEAESKGFKVVESSNACIRYVEYINKAREVIRVEKELHVVPGMRYIDLEHELGHIRQLEKFDWKLFIDRFMEKPNGNLKEFNNGDDILHEWRNTVTELHNRLQEFLRLYERKADKALLLEHSKASNGGVMEWIHSFRNKVTKTKQNEWVEQHFPDLKDLRKQYADVIDELNKIYPDDNFE